MKNYEKIYPLHKQTIISMAYIENAILFRSVFGISYQNLYKYS